MPMPFWTALLPPFLDGTFPPPMNGRLTLVYPQKKAYNTARTVRTAKAPMLYRGSVANVLLVREMPLASSSPFPSERLTTAITSMVNSVVKPI